MRRFNIFGHPQEVNQLSLKFQIFHEKVHICLDTLKEISKQLSGKKSSKGPGTSFKRNLIKNCHKKEQIKIKLLAIDTTLSF
jgi:hypothetical protein